MASSSLELIGEGMMGGMVQGLQVWGREGPTAFT